MNFFNGSNNCGDFNNCNGTTGCDCCSMLIWIMLLQCLCQNNNACGIDPCTLIMILLLCGGCGNGCNCNCK